MTPRSAARVATKRNPARKSASTPSATVSTAGTRKISVRSCGTTTTARLTKAKAFRVFPLSNWTELDIWQYIYLENIEIVPLYLAAERPVLERDGMLMMIDDDRIDLQPGEVIEKRMVRFRTLGCWPLTGAVESEAQTLPEIIEEMLVSTTSERQGRVIGRDQAAARWS
ncbi:phosphoadenosine phosphosulfate reductase family protein [Klebsiella pneumoniae]